MLQRYSSLYPNYVYAIVIVQKKYLIFSYNQDTTSLRPSCNTQRGEQSRVVDGEKKMFKYDNEGDKNNIH